MYGYPCSLCTCYILKVQYPLYPVQGTRTNQRLDQVNTQDRHNLSRQLQLISFFRLGQGRAGMHMRQEGGGGVDGQHASASWDRRACRMQTQTASLVEIESGKMLLRANLPSVQSVQSVRSTSIYIYLYDRALNRCYYSIISIIVCTSIMYPSPDSGGPKSPLARFFHGPRWSPSGGFKFSPRIIQVHTLL